jgi:hypothetical protein
MADIGTLTPEQMLQQQQTLRQQKMAEMLMQQGMEQPKGQMISGHYVAPSITQNLAGLANVYFGQRGIEKADKAQIDLAKAIRAQHIDELNQFNQLLPKNPMEAYSFAAQAYNPKLQEIGMKKMLPQEFDLSEGQKRYMTMPDGTVKEVASGGQKFRAPLQIDTGTAIELRDPSNPTVVLQRISKSMNPADAARLADEGITVGGGGYNAPAVNPVPMSNPAMNNAPVGTSPVIKQNAQPVSVAPNAPAYAQNSLTMQPVNANNLPVPPLVNMAGVSPKEQRKMAGTQAEALQANVKNAYEAYPVIRDIEKLLPQSSSGYTQRGWTGLTRGLGVSTDMSKADTQLDLLAPKLTMLQPRFEGPQGVLDVKLYESMAGRLADSSLPYEDRLAALEQLKNIYKRYSPNLDWSFAPTPVTVPKSNAPQQTSKAPAGIDPAVWSVMTPQEKSLWQK